MCLHTCLHDECSLAKGCLRTCLPDERRIRFFTASGYNLSLIHMFDLMFKFGSDKIQLRSQQSSKTTQGSYSALPL